MRNEFGEGSTPALFGNTLVIVWDHIKGPSYILALDKRTGKELWRTSRDEMDTWATPLVVTVDGRHQVIVPAMNKRPQLRPRDRRGGLGGARHDDERDPVARVRNGIVFLMSGFRGNNLKAIRLSGAKGDITGPNHIAWELDRDTPYVPSPLLYDGILYFLKTNNGLLSAFDAASGKPHYQVQRLDKVPNVFSSPVGAEGRVYIAGREGTTLFSARTEVRGPGRERAGRRVRRVAGARRSGDFLRGYRICTASQNRPWALEPFHDF